MFWTGPNVLDMVQNEKFSSEKLFLVRSITFYSLDLLKDKALETNFKEILELKLFVDQTFLNSQHLTNYLQASVEVNLTLFFIYIYNHNYVEVS